MKLGKQTNSLINHVLSRAVIGQPEPVEGMGCTLLSWTDRYPATVINVSGFGDKLIVQADTATRADSNGMSESQTYEYTRNPNGALYTFRKTKSGAWEEIAVNPKTGRYNKTGGYGLRIGERDKYHDYSF